MQLSLPFFTFSLVYLAGALCACALPIPSGGDVGQERCQEVEDVQTAKVKAYDQGSASMPKGSMSKIDDQL